MEKVLILDGGAAHAMAIAECLKKNGYHVAVICDNKDEYGYHSKFADERHIGPDSHNVGYAAFMLTFLKEHHFDVLIPTSDAAAEFMSFHKDELMNLSGVLMPSRDVFEKGYDKNQLMRVCKENGFPHPLTIDISEIEHNLADGATLAENAEFINFPYPGLLKPNLTSGGRGMTLVSSLEEFLQVYPSIHEQYGDCHLQKFIPKGGRQIKVQIMTDEQGNMAYSWLIR